MFTLTESREVHATPEQVYTVVADIRNYRHWNPWNVYASGEIFEGSLVDITAHMAGKKLQIRHKILRMQPNEVFAWCDTGWFTHFAYGERTRYISPSENGAHYRCELKISGIFSPFV